MKSFHNKIHCEEQLANLEITEAQIVSSRDSYLQGGNLGLHKYQSKRIKYPRHINQRVSRSHRKYGAISHSNFSIPKTCSIPNSKSAENTLSLWQYQLQDEAAKKAHLENIKLNLERRLQAAKAQGNDYLINLLQKESRELEFS